MSEKKFSKSCDIKCVKDNKCCYHTDTAQLSHWYYAHEEEECIRVAPDNRVTFVGSHAIQPVKLLMPVIKAVQSE